MLLTPHSAQDAPRDDPAARGVKLKPPGSPAAVTPGGWASVSGATWGPGSGRIQVQREERAPWGAWRGQDRAALGFHNGRHAKPETEPRGGDAAASIVHGGNRTPQLTSRSSGSGGLGVTTSTGPAPPPRAEHADRHLSRPLPEEGRREGEGRPSRPHPHLHPRSSPRITAESSPGSAQPLASMSRAGMSFLPPSSRPDAPGPGLRTAARPPTLRRADVGGPCGPAILLPGGNGEKP